LTRRDVPLPHGSTKYSLPVLTTAATNATNLKPVGSKRALPMVPVRQATPPTLAVTPAAPAPTPSSPLKTTTTLPAGSNAAPTASPGVGGNDTTTIRRRIASTAAKNWMVSYDEIEFHKKIGAGSFGEVWTAELWGMECAVKKIPDSLISDEAVGDFLSELEILAGLRHPNIVLMLAAVVEAGGRMAIVSELCTRGSVNSVLTNKSLQAELTLGRRSHFALDCAYAMLYLHKLNIVHCVREDDHQLLTNRGFLFLDEVEAHVERDAAGSVVDWRGLKVASFDERRQQIVYETPLALTINEPRPGDTVLEMAEIADGRENTVRFAVTAGHHMYASIDGAPFAKVRADELAAAAERGAVVQFQRWASGGAAPLDVASGVASASTVAPLQQARASAIGTSMSAQRERIEVECAGAASFECGDEYDGPLDIEPFIELGVTTASEATAFLELYGHWLVDGTLAVLDGRHRITFSTCKKTDLLFLLDRLATLGWLDDARLYRAHRPGASDIADDCADDDGASDGDNGRDVDPDSPILPYKAVVELNMLAAVRMFSREYECHYAGAAERVRDRVKGAKWLFEWVLRRLWRTGCRAIVVGLRVAGGRQAQHQNCIFTSSVHFRDELMQLFLHAGFSAHTCMSTPAGTRKSLDAIADHTQYMVRFSEERALNRPLSVVRVPLTSRTWCFTTPSGYIVARQAQRVAAGDFIAAQDGALELAVLDRLAGAAVLDLSDAELVAVYEQVVTAVDSTLAARGKRDRRSRTQIIAKSAARLATKLRAELSSAGNAADAVRLVAQRAAAAVAAVRVPPTTFTPGSQWVVTSASPATVQGNCDLKARNLLIDKDWNAKLCDFGLSMVRTDSRVRLAGTRGYMAPELMCFYADIYDGRAEMIFTFKSDVYSYGILLNEIYASTDAEMVDWANTNEELEAIARGDRPRIPPNMHANYRELMVRCWDQQPEVRPLFKDVITTLKPIVSEFDAMGKAYPEV
jgi:hypothetical protein